MTRATVRCIVGLHKNLRLLISLFQASIGALNRRRGDTHKQDRKTVLTTVLASLQCTELLLSSLRLLTALLEIELLGLVADSERKILPTNKATSGPTFKAQVVFFTGMISYLQYTSNLTNWFEHLYWVVIDSNRRSH